MRIWHDAWMSMKFSPRRCGLPGVSSSLPRSGGWTTDGEADDAMEETCFLRRVLPRCKPRTPFTVQFQFQLWKGLKEAAKGWDDGIICVCAWWSGATGHCCCSVVTWGCRLPLAVAVQTGQGQPWSSACLRVRPQQGTGMNYYQLPLCCAFRLSC